MNVHQPPTRGRGKIFMHGRSQAVRLPKEFRLPGKEVIVTRSGTGVLIEPVTRTIQEWFAELDKYKDIPFMEDGRDQPPVPESRVDFDSDD